MKSRIIIITNIFIKDRGNTIQSTEFPNIRVTNYSRLFKFEEPEFIYRLNERIEIFGFYLNLSKNQKKKTILLRIYFFRNI